MDTSSEQQRIAFSQRLAAEFLRLGLPLESPTRIARTFNQKFSGKPVTAQSVRKWLLAETMPTQPKLLVLAAWFGVSAQWLRFGEGSRSELPTAPALVPESPQPAPLALDKEDAELIQVVDMLIKLSPRNRLIVAGMIRLLQDEASGQ